jgi:hypothetical protein
LGELKRIVKQHGGSIVGTVDGASHVIDWDEEVDSLPTELSEEFVRTLEVRPSEEGGRALVHWFYHPDSYDEWIPSDHVDVSEPPDTVSELNLNRQWHVCCRFVIDCNIFNEWGNEIDYENIPEGEGEDDDTNDDGTSTISPVKSGAVRKARGRRRSEAVKAKKMPILESIVVTEKMMQDSPPPLDNSTFESIAVIDILAGSECQLSFINPRKTEGRALIDSNIEILEKADDTLGVTNSIGTKRPAGASNDRSSSSTSSKHKKDRVLGRKGSSQPHLKLPSWYTSESVNAIEIKYLPDIFSREADRAKNVGEYLTMRNFIVSMYAHNPSIYISATDCRRKMSGDVCTVLKIHDFLDSFGVINFNVKPENRPLSPHALIPHWYQDSKSTLSSGMSVMSSVDSVGDELTVAWSDSMDRSLRRCAVANQGDWAVVASILAIEFSNYGAADNSNSWKPTSQDCMARFVSLPLKAPSFNCTKYKGSADIGLASIAAAKAAQQLQFLSSQIADSAASALGFDTVQNVVTDTLLSLSSEVSGLSNISIVLGYDSWMILTTYSNCPHKIIEQELSTDSILSATNPNSTAIKNFLGELESQIDSISDDAASCYLDNLEEKVHFCHHNRYYVSVLFFIFLMLCLIYHF